MRRKYTFIRILAAVLAACLLFSGCSIRLKTPDSSPTVSAGTSSASPATGATPGQTAKAAEISNPVITRDGDIISLTQTAVIGAGMPSFLFQVTGTESDGLYTSQALLVLEGEEPVVNFELDHYGVREDFGFRLVDINFDGYLDIMLALGFLDNIGNAIYATYFWDEAESIFVRDYGLEFIPNPVADTERKAIINVEITSALERTFNFIEYEEGAYYYARSLTEAMFFGVEEGCYWAYSEDDYTLEESNIQRFTVYGTDPAVDPRVAEYYKPGSAWDLHHPAWFSYDTAPTPDFSGMMRYMGLWYGSDVVGSGFNERWSFDEYGGFVYGTNEMEENDVLYESGAWVIRSGMLYLNIMARVELKDGEREIVYLDPFEAKWLPVGEFGHDNDRDIDTLTIGGKKYWKYDNQYDMFDSFYELAD